MEDDMVLLQTGKRLTSAASRRESICWSDDSFSLPSFTISSDIPISNRPPTPPRFLSESETITNLLSNIKAPHPPPHCRRRHSRRWALLRGKPTLHQIVGGRCGAPQGVLAECYMHRAAAYQSAGRIVESIADCNRTLALDPTCIQALETRALLLESIRCFFPVHVY